MSDLLRLISFIAILDGCYCLGMAIVRLFALIPLYTCARILQQGLPLYCHRASEAVYSPAYLVIVLLWIIAGAAFISAGVLIGEQK